MKSETLGALSKLQKRGFITHAFATADEMQDFILASISPGESVGFGGSVTAVKNLKLYDRLRDRGNTVYHHWFAEPARRAETYKNAHTADVYLMSSNAVTGDGCILNIDGNGNRIAALMNGPRTVYILLGENKFVTDREAAIDRVKTVACPQNARRLGLKTPCATVEHCTDCSSPQRMCNYVLWTEHAPKDREIHVCVAAESLGF